MNKNSYGDTLPKRLYIVGYNEESLKLYNTAKDSDIALITSEEPTKCAKIKAIYTTEAEKVIIDDILKARLTAIINTKNDEENIRICKAVIEYLNALINKSAEGERPTLIRKLFSSFKLFVIGGGEFSPEYENIEDTSFGCIRYLNKETSLAFEFIDKYPIAKFIPRDKILPDTTIKADYKLNVVMVGFNELNKKILTTSIANNQFLSHNENEEVIPKPVSYTILSEGVDNSKKREIPLFRYETEFLPGECGATINPDDYLELPPPPAIVNFVDTKFDTGALKDKILALCGGENSLTAIIINYSSMEENLALARAISSELPSETNVNIKIFCRADGGGCAYPFGLTSHFFDTEEIIKDTLYNMAIGRNRIYTLESEYLKDIADGSFDGAFEDIIDLADYKWYTKRSYTDKYSNIYAMLSIRSKLNLLGLDYVDITDPRDEIDSYDTIYTKGEIRFLSGIEVMGRKIPAEMTYEFTSSVRGILAHQEHYRWNSYMLSMGYIPASIDNILNERNTNSGYTNGKNTAQKRHGNITTAEGLIRYRQLLSLRDECDELERDVICYDYQLMDDVVWLLKRCGYKIIAGGEL